MNPAAGELFPGSLPASIAGAAWTWVLALLLGASLPRALRPLDHGERAASGGDDGSLPDLAALTAWCVLGIAAQAMAWHALSALGAVTPVMVLSVAAGLTLAGAIAGGRRAVREGRHLAAALGGLSRPPVLLAGGAVMAALTLAVGRLALLPSVYYDDLVYHLALPRQALLRGTWPADPGFHYSFMPAGWDSVYLLPLSLGGGSGPQLMNVVTLALLALTAARLARRGGSASAAAIVVPALFVAPLFASMGAFAANDLFVALALATALERLLATAGSRPVEAGLLAGAAWAAKYTAITGLGALVLAALALPGTARRRAGRAAVVGALALVVGLPGTARAFALTGNPVYPVLWDLLGGRWWDHAAHVQLAGDSSYGAFDQRGPLVVVHALVDLFTRSGSMGFPSGIHAAFVALALVGLALARRVRGALALGVAAGVAYAGWCATALTLRYATFLLVALVPFAAAAVEAALRPVRARGLLARSPWPAIALLAALAVPFWKAIDGHLAFVQVGRHGMTRDDFLVNRLALAAAQREAVRNLPPHARVLLLGEARLALVPRPARAASAYEGHSIQPWLAPGDTGEDALRRLARDFTHVLVNHREMQRLDAQYGHARRLDPSQQAALDWLLETGLAPVARWGDVVMYETPPLELLERPEGR